LETPVAKKVRKNPDVDTSFLPDREREEQENRLREELRQVLNHLIIIYSFHLHPIKLLNNKYFLMGLIIFFALAPLLVCLKIWYIII
jgi:hypothetical protein